MLAALVSLPNTIPPNLLATMGIGSATIGFRHILENFLAGTIILSRQERHIGDFIKYQGIERKVDDMSVRKTHLLHTDDQLLIVPNNMSLQNARAF